MRQITDNRLNSLLNREDNKPYDYVSILLNFDLSANQIEKTVDFVEKNNVFSSTPLCFDGFVEALLAVQKNTLSDTIKKHIEFLKQYKKFFYALSYSNINLSEKFIEEYADKLDWNYLSFYQNLSESFVEKHLDKVNFENYIIKHIVSEDFIEKHADSLIPVCWATIFNRYPTLLEEFKAKYSNKLK